MESAHAYRVSDVNIRSISAYHAGAGDRVVPPKQGSDHVRTAVGA
jgi:hypothetical protein